jgi:serine/threonine protein kinase
MPPDCVPDCGTHPGYTKRTGYSPLPGYVLLEPLGRGGFGEVWKCEAPGGLHKAVKFVSGDALGVGTDASGPLRQEFEAFQQVKAIRHPFLLSLERVELLDGELVMVMELADRQLGDRYQECRGTGLPGIPRDELLGYLREAAEALDVIGEKYGLQHLDVKPANLFLTAGHVQVGDYGLVSRLDGKGKADNRGLTPRYAAPEVLRGEIHTRSDQYSLALVYFELLTGAFPYNARNVQLMMMQHLSAVPDLTALPEPDRSPVGAALAKRPEERFESCTAFVQALTRAARPTATLRAAQPRTSPAAPIAHVFAPNLPGAPTRGSGGASDTTRRNLPSFSGPPDTPAAPPPAAPRTPSGVLIDPISSVVPVAWLKGRGGPPATGRAVDVVRAVVKAAEAESGPGSIDGIVTRAADGAWECRFLTNIDPRVARVKLKLLWEQTGVMMDARTMGRVLFRQVMPVPPPEPSGIFSLSKKPLPPPPPESGFEVVIDLPDPNGKIVEGAARATFFGTPSADFRKVGEATIGTLMEGILSTLHTVPERRKHPRVSASFGLALYPLHSEGRVAAPIQGFCHDVSAGGLSLFCPTEPKAKYAYVVFEEVPDVERLAVLIQINRSERRHDEVFVSGRFRLDVTASRS